MFEEGQNDKRNRNGWILHHEQNGDDKTDALSRSCDTNGEGERACFVRYNQRSVS